MPFASIQGTELFYESHGAGPALVFAHGRGGNHLSWWQQIAAFHHSCRCVAYDQRGWGMTAGPAEAPAPETLVNDLRALLDYLEIERAVVVTQSMGGIAGLGLALSSPERVVGLVLADTTGGIGDPSVVELLQDVHPPADPLRRALSDGFIADQPGLAFLYGAIGRLNPEKPVSIVSGMFRNARGPQAADLASLTAPTLFVVGAEDQIFPPLVIAAASQLIPGSRLEIVPGAAHSTHFEQAEIFNELLREFLSEVGLPTTAAVAAD